MKRCILTAFLALSMNKSWSITVFSRDINEKIPINYMIWYEVEDYFKVATQSAKKSFDAFLKSKGLKAEKAFATLKDHALQGDKDSRRILLYLVFDKYMEGEFPDKYNSIFKDYLWSQKDKEQMQYFFIMEKSDEGYFIEAFKNYFSIKAIPKSKPLQIYQAYQRTLFALSKIKNSDIKDAGFLWAFIVLDIYYSAYNKLLLGEDMEEQVSQAEGIVQKLAEENYASAQYFQALLSMKKNRFGEAVYWFEKSFLKVNQPPAFLLLYYLYRYYEKQPTKSQNFMIEAIYEHGLEALKVNLLGLYVSEGQDFQAYSLAVEMLENYNRYTLDDNLYSFNFIIVFLSQYLEKNKEEVLKWHYKLKIFSKRYQVNIENQSMILKMVEQTADKELIERAKKRAEKEMLEAFIWNESDGQCYSTIKTIH